MVEEDWQRKAFLKRLKETFGDEIESVDISSLDEKPFKPKKKSKKNIIKKFVSRDIKGKIYAQTEEEIEKIRFDIISNWGSESEFISAIVHYYVYGMISPSEKKLIKEIWDEYGKEEIEEISLSQKEKIAREVSSKIRKKI